MSVRKQRVLFSKKNNGQDLMIEFFWLMKKDTTTVDKIRVEQWVDRFGVAMLTAFRIEFPEL